MADISIIDDSQATLEVLTAILYEKNHHVTTYTSGVDIENTLATTKPDLVLLDVVMPDRNGYEVLRALRRNEATKDIPVILVSSKGEESDIRWGKRQGAVDYIAKPFSSASLLRTIESCL